MSSAMSVEHRSLGLMACASRVDTQRGFVSLQERTASLNAIFFKTDLRRSTGMRAHRVVLMLVAVCTVLCVLTPAVAQAQPVNPCTLADFGLVGIVASTTAPR